MKENIKEIFPGLLLYLAPYIVFWVFVESLSGDFISYRNKEEVGVACFIAMVMTFLGLYIKNKRKNVNS